MEKNVKLIHTYVDEVKGEMLVFQQNYGYNKETGMPMSSWFKVSAANINEWMPTPTPANEEASAQTATEPTAQPTA